MATVSAPTAAPLPGRCEPSRTDDDAGRWDEAAVLLRLRALSGLMTTRPYDVVHGQLDML